MAGKHDQTQADTLLTRVWLPLPNYNNFRYTGHKPGPDIGGNLKLLNLPSVVYLMTFSGPGKHYECFPFRHRACKNISLMHNGPNGKLNLASGIGNERIDV